MPIYDFRCRKCGTVSEILVRGAEGERAQCSSCGSLDRERLISSSYMLQMTAPAHGTTCCGSTERCDTPPCSSGESCHRRGGSI